MKKQAVIGVTVIAFVMCVAGALAAPGDLDPTFGVDGVVRTDVGFLDSPSDLAVQTDGRLVAAGSVDRDGTRNVFVARYGADGLLDESFGIGGVVAVGRYHQVAPRLVLQADEKIVLVTRSETSGGAFFYRFTTDGQPDTSFGPSSDGTALLPPPPGYGILGVAGADALADGTVIAAFRANVLTSGREVIALVRLGADGDPDASFGVGGFVIAERSASWTPLAFGVDAEGRMLVGGYASPAAGRFFLDAFVARFMPDGSVDASFGSGGVAMVERPENGSEFQALAAAPDGTIVAGGREWGSVYNQSQWLLARFTETGAPDATFGTDGLILYDPAAGHDVVLDVAVVGEHVYATGETEGLALGLPLVLFTNSGALETSFGTNGVTGIADAPSRGARRLAVQGDRRAVVLGAIQSWTPSFNQDLWLARYDGPSADTTPPQLTLPAAMSADATSPAGAIVTYAASAVDDVDGSVQVTCAPPSSSVFPIGDTVVDCSATDAAGNTSTGSFTIHVKGADEQLADLIGLLESYELGKLGTSLRDKLATVQRFLATGKPRQAEDNLESFVAQVEAQRGKGLTVRQADALMTAAHRIIDVIEL